MDNALSFLQDYLSYPSISTDPDSKEGMAQAQNHIIQLLKKLDFQTELVSDPNIIQAAGHPIILAKRIKKGAPHILLYGHYDVQPADPLDLWDTPAFKPHIRNNRLYARGAADNKGPHVAMLYGLAKALDKNPDLNISLTLLLEGEEEIGSPSILPFLNHYKEELNADFILLSDTCSPSSNQIAVTTGLRGVCTLEIIITGPNADLHSGLHGGAVANPLQVLVELCASLHKPDGTVNIPGFYTDCVPPQEWERNELQLLPLTDNDYQKSIGVPSLKPLPGYTAQESIRFFPTLEFNGIGGGYQGPGSKTIIPDKAFAKISCRLVPDQNNKKIIQLLKQEIIKRCPPTVNIKINEDLGGNPYIFLNPNQETDSKASNIVKKAFQVCEDSVKKVTGQAPLFLREGGSIPLIRTLKDVLNLDALMIGLFTPEDKIHSPNESMDLDLFAKGIDIYALFFENLSTDSTK